MTRNPQLNEHGELQHLLSLDGLPREIVNDLNTQVRRLTASKPFQDRFGADGFEPNDLDPAAYERFVREEMTQLRGELDEISNYCETDVVNTYLVYLRFQLMRGMLSADQYKQEMALLRATLEKSTLPHWREFLQLWQA